MFTDWTSGPPIMRWIGCRFLTLSIVFAGSAIAMAILQRPLGMARVQWWKWTIFTLGVTPLVLLMPYFQWHARRLRREFHAAHGRLCVHCGYNLSASPARGLCPECGHAIDTGQDAQMWKVVGFELPDQRSP